MAKKTAKPAEPSRRPQQEFRDLLKEKNLKVTSARLAVLGVLASASKPLTHAEVQEQLQEHSIDQSTIFRNLNDLTEAGLLNRTELGDHMWRFELVRGGHTNDHPHFVCVDCGTVTCLEESALNLTHQKKVSGVGIISQVLVKGHCLDCSDGKSS